MLNSKEVEKIKKIEGRARGVIFQTDIQYIEGKMGKKEANKIRREIKKIIPEYDHSQIKTTDWYPLWWRIISLKVIKNHFNWGKKELVEMGHSAPGNSFLVRVILRYFVSLKKTFQEGKKYWDKHYHPGNFESIKFNNKEQYVIFRIKNFKGHPDLCFYLQGYFKAIAELTLPGKKIDIKETKCLHKKGPCHEFKLSWK